MTASHRRSSTTILPEAVMLAAVGMPKSSARVRSWVQMLLYVSGRRGERASTTGRTNLQQYRFGPQPYLGPMLALQPKKVSRQDRMTKLPYLGFLHSLQTGINVAARSPRTVHRQYNSPPASHRKKWVLRHSTPATDKKKKCTRPWNLAHHVHFSKSSLAPRRLHDCYTHLL